MKLFFFCLGNMCCTIICKFRVQENNNSKNIDMNKEKLQQHSSDRLHACCFLIQPCTITKPSGSFFFLLISVLPCPFPALSFQCLPSAKEMPNYNLLKTNELNNYHLRHHYPGNNRTEEGKRKGICHLPQNRKHVLDRKD